MSCMPPPGPLNKRVGYVYVDEADVPSILRVGYLSVAEQVKRGLVSMSALWEKYGVQYENARLKYTQPPDACPEGLLAYLSWRCMPDGDGQTAIYYLFQPVDETEYPFVKGKALLRLQIPDGAVCCTVPARPGGLWFSRIEHAFALATLIPPDQVTRVQYGRW